MRTVLITIYQAVEAKNILRTDIIRSLLAEPDVRAVCLTKFKERADYYRQEIPHERIIYDYCDQEPGGALERYFSALKFHLIRTATTDLRRRMNFEESGNYFSYLIGRALNFLLARGSIRRLARFLDYHLVSDSGFGDILRRYQPDVVFFAHLFDDAEIALLRQAKKRGIPTVGFINSWDKLTARSAVRLLPDRLVVYNDIVKQEAVEHADMPPEKIVVSGIPQYDQYFTPGPVSRQEFCAKAGLDPKRAIVLLAPMGRAFSNSDWEMIDMLHEIISPSQGLPLSQLLVRFQPNDFIDEVEISRRPWLRYSLPGIRFGTRRGGDWDMRFEELTHLNDTLFHSSLLVSYASSMSVDAAIFGKPVINIDFELKPGESMSKSPTFYYQTDHYKKALLTGGIRLVKSRDELIQWLRRYLQDPSLDREGRERLVKEQCGLVDGKAGERIARAIFGVLQVLQ